MATTAERLRQLLNEEIPDGMSDKETLFTDEQIADLLFEADDIPEAAAGKGWFIKAGKLADLVDTAEGTSKRSMSDLHKNALAMVAAYGDTGSTGGSAGRTRLRRLVRR